MKYDTDKFGVDAHIQYARIAFLLAITLTHFKFELADQDTDAVLWYFIRLVVNRFINIGLDT